MSKSTKPFREERWFGSREECAEYLVRFYWDLTEQRATPYWIDFEIYPVAGYDHPSGEREFYANESQEFGDGLTKDIASAHLECNGFVKWDGCTQIYFAADRNSPALHFDDGETMRLFFECLTYARARCLEVMPEAAP